MTKNDTIVEDLKKTDIPDFLSEREKVMVEYSLKLTRTPWEMAETDVSKLRAVEFSDQAILNLAMVNAYFAFVNRMADGLGIDLEDYWDEDKKSG